MQSSSKSPRAVPSLLAISTLAALALLIGSATGDERHFGYVYETAVLAPGGRDLEVSNTLRAGREEYYSALDHRLEFEVGVADNLMTSFYLNMSNTTAANGSGGLTSDFAWGGFSNEWKWRLMDPVANPVGLALYAELTYATDGFELEPKILVDKRLGNWILAANLVTEFEYESQIDKAELEEIAPDVVLGATCQLGKGFYAGVELNNHNAFIKNAASGDLEHEFSSLYAGPVVSYTTPSWWVTLSVLPQLPALSKREGGSILELDDGEKLNARLLLSFHL
jgi:hypothetical protein